MVLLANLPAIIQRPPQTWVDSVTRGPRGGPRPVSQFLQRKIARLVEPLIERDSRLRVRQRLGDEAELALKFLQFLGHVRDAGTLFAQQSIDVPPLRPHPSKTGAQHVVFAHVSPKQFAQFGRVFLLALRTPTPVSNTFLKKPPIGSGFLVPTHDLPSATSVLTQA